MEDAVTAPFGQCRDRVRSEWIDENQHMNLGYYVVAFDWATDMWFDHMGFDETHRQTRGARHRWRPRFCGASRRSVKHTSNFRGPRKRGDALDSTENQSAESPTPIGSSRLGGAIE